MVSLSTSSMRAALVSPNQTPWQAQMGALVVDFMHNSRLASFRDPVHGVGLSRVTA